MKYIEKWKYNDYIYDTKAEFLERFDYLSPAGIARDFENMILYYLYTDYSDEHKNKISLDEIEKEKKDILKWFLTYDYYNHKITTGEWEKDDSRWTWYITERINKRSRLDELNTLLGGE